jgi:hypothetical protein
VALVFEGKQNDPSQQDVEREHLVLSLPTEAMNQVPIRLTLEMAPSPGDPHWMKLRGVSAGFGPVTLDASPEATRAYEYLWSIHRQAELGSLRKAARTADPDRLRTAVENKQLNPTAAMAAALLLVQAGQIRRLGDWTRNLQNNFPETPDGAVLWCESLRQSHLRGESEFFGVSDIVAEAAHALLQLEQRGMPFLAGTVELAEQQARWLLRQKLDAAVAPRIQALRNELELASSISVAGGHFMAYAAAPRPEKLAGSGALTVLEILRVIRPRLVNA